MVYWRLVVVGDQPKTWARRHDSFASEPWIIAKVKWGPERWEWVGNGQFVIFTYGDEGNRKVRVKLKAQGYWERNDRIPSRVEVIRAHAFG
jgi:hypothetical protein